MKSLENADLKLKAKNDTKKYTLRELMIKMIKIMY